MRLFTAAIAIVLIGTGTLLALYGLTGAFADLARSAVQQTVLELRLLNGAIGLVLVGLGTLLLRGNRPNEGAEG